jgi:hypothetical protein
MGLLLLMLATLGAVGCAAQEKTTPAGGGGALPAPAQPTAAHAQPSAPVAAPTGAHGESTDVPIPPNAQFTIALRAYGGANHDLVAKQMKAQMIQAGLNNAYVVVGDKESTLYYGFYPSATDPRARADLLKLSRWKTSFGEQPFAGSLLVELNPKDPPAPPEWNLANSKDYWSLQIAAYKDSPLRKKAAVDAVRAARAQGIEAYYYHGETTSSVCIGTWPRSAIKEQNSDRGETTASDMDRPIVVSTVPLAGLVNGPVIDRATGQTAKVYAPRIQIEDPTMIAAMKKYPYHLVNGELHATVTVDPQTGQRHKVDDRSFLVVIPGAEARYQAELNGRPASAGETANGPHNASPIPPSMLLGRPAQGGKLRSLNDPK